MDLASNHAKIDLIRMWEYDHSKQKPGTCQAREFQVAPTVTIVQRTMSSTADCAAPQELTRYQKGLLTKARNAAIRKAAAELALAKASDANIMMASPEEAIPEGARRATRRSSGKQQTSFDMGRLN